MIGACVISARILWLYCETALGPWAGADIAAPGGRSAGKGPDMAEVDLPPDVVSAMRRLPTVERDILRAFFESIYERLDQLEATADWLSDRANESKWWERFVDGHPELSDDA